METFTEAEATRRLAELVRRAEAGETIAISRGGVVVARLGPPPPAAESPEPAAKRLMACRRFD